MKERGVVNRLARAWGLGAASAYRACLRRPVFVAVTGSSGKTTAKRLIAAVLGARQRGVASHGSMNAAGEVARTIFRTRPWHDYCVQEVGAARPGSLAPVLRILRPQIGVVINVGFDHYSAFRTAERVAEEKGNVVEILPPSGVAVLNADDARVASMATRTRARVLFYGTSEQSELRAHAITAQWPDRLCFTVSYGGESVRVQTRLCSDAWVPSVLAALAVGVATGLPLAEAAAAVERVEPEPGRLSPVFFPNGVTFIRDDWKSPTWSLPVLLRFVQEARATRRLLVLGSLSDDPQKPRRLYAQVAREAAAAADEVLLVGERAEHGLRARAGADDTAIRAFATVRELEDFLAGHLRPGDLVVLRGSSTVDHLERLVFNREKPIGCWRTRCGVRVYCDACRWLRRPYDPARDPAVVSP